MLLSLLVPTLESRRKLFAGLRACLLGQIDAHGLAAQVELLELCDSGELPIGRKRNLLLERARGEFVAFIDDDDMVSGDYVPRVCEAITREPEIDCIGIRGMITFRGGHPREFVHSLRYDDYFSRHGVYYRPPYHLNPIRRSIALRYPFPEVSYSEDIDFALRLARDGALRREHFIDAILYYYRCRRWWPYQWALDHTEQLRHALGLRAVNRLRVRPAANTALGQPPAGERS